MVVVFLMAIVQAASADNWSRGVQAAESPYGYVDAIIIGNFVGIRFKTDECEKVGAYSEENTARRTNEDVNGVIVGFFSQCTNGYRGYMARTDAGTQYILDQFKSKNKVTFAKTFTFNAAGFSKALKEAMNTKGAL